MTAKLQKLRNPSFLFFLGVIVVSVLIGILSRSYFTERIFYVLQDRYTFDSQQGNLVTYRSDTGSPIRVRIEDPKRTVIIDDNSYIITKGPVYDVVYPHGTRYEVQEQSGNLLAFDDKGEFVFEDQEGYPPSQLVEAAYPEYHVTSGAPVLLILALAMLIYGWCGYRYEKFQTIMFRLSPRNLFYDNPEPSDFYYFMCKVGGIIVMIASVPIAFKAFE